MICPTRPQSALSAFKAAALSIHQKSACVQSQFWHATSLIQFFCWKSQDTNRYSVVCRVLLELLKRVLRWSLHRLLHLVYEHDVVRNESLGRMWKTLLVVVIHVELMFPWGKKVSSERRFLLDAYRVEMARVHHTHADFLTVWRCNIVVYWRLVHILRVSLVFLRCAKRQRNSGHFVGLQWQNRIKVCVVDRNCSWLRLPLIRYREISPLVATFRLALSCRLRRELLERCHQFLIALLLLRLFIVQLLLHWCCVVRTSTGCTSQ